MKKVLAMLLMWGLITGSALFAQDEKKEEPKYGWVNELVGAANFTQTNLNNWKQGGEDSWVWQLDVNGKFVNDQQKTNWANTGKISYGRTKVGDGESQKSADEIFAESVLTYKLGVLINPYVAVSGRSQLTSSFDFSASPKEEIAKFLNPGYFTESFGIGYQPSKEFKTRMGLALKQTVTTDDSLALRYTDSDGLANGIDKLRSEVGLESVSDFSRKLAENILFTSKLELFSNLKSADEIDVRWDNLISAKVSKLITVSFNVQLFYDKDIDIKRQLKEVLAVGLSYSFL